MLNNWGIALFEQAMCKSGEEADALFRHAGEKYAAALAIEPDDSDVLNNWGSMFLIWLSRKEGREAERMLGEAENKFRQAAKLNIGSASYGLACVAGRRGDEEQCLSFLKQAKEHGALPDCKHLLSDPDLVSIRDKPWVPGVPRGLVKRRHLLDDAKQDPLYSAKHRPSASYDALKLLG